MLSGFPEAESGVQSSGARVSLIRQLKPSTWSHHTAMWSCHQSSAPSSTLYLGHHKTSQVQGNWICTENCHSAQRVSPQWSHARLALTPAPCLNTRYIYQTKQQQKLLDFTVKKELLIKFCPTTLFNDTV